MEWQHLYDLLRQRVRFLTAGSLIAMLFAYLAFRIFTPWPQYQATTTVLVNYADLSSSPTTARLSPELVRTYSEWMLQGPVLQGVIEVLDLSLDPTGLREKIVIRQVPNSYLLEVSALSREPEQAAAIANEIVVQLEHQIGTALSSSYPLDAPTQIEIEFLNENIRTAEEKLIELNDSLVKTPSAVSLLQLEINELETRIYNAEEELIDLSKQLDVYQPPALPAEEIASLVQNIQENEEQLQIFTDRLLETNNVIASDFLVKQINALQGNLQLWRNELDRLYTRNRADSESEFSRLVRRINVIQTNLSVWRNKLDLLNNLLKNSTQGRYEEVNRQIDAVQSNLEIWQKQYADLKSQYSTIYQSNLFVLEKAQIPTGRLNPIINIIVAGITGLLLTSGITILYYRETGENDDQ
ncbi:MAG TPA: hypothetical protein VJL34_09545 [Anaerolineales bacterium]|nr:hypothetical protein [Anaerolineales bacterium]